MCILRIAAVGWRHENWEHGYYPEDMPADWKLAFYANDFRALVLPQQHWQTLDDEACAALADEVDEGFRFYLGVDAEAPPAAAFAVAVSGFSGKLGGFLLKKAMPLPPILADRPDVPVIIGCDQQAAVTGQAACWLHVQSAKPCRHNTVVIDERLTLRELRDGFARLQEFSATDSDRLVVIDLAQPDVAYMQEIRTLLELMGIA